MKLYTVLDAYCGEICGDPAVTYSEAEVLLKLKSELRPRAAEVLPRMQIGNVFKPSPKVAIVCVAEAAPRKIVERIFGALVSSNGAVSRDIGLGLVDLHALAEHIAKNISPRRRTS